MNKKEAERLKRILLLIVAVTVHNIPEGLAVGVAFGSIGKSASATFESARSLAIGIGIQNFPEGLAVSLPLKTAGFSAAKSIWYGQVTFFSHIFCFQSCFNVSRLSIYLTAQWDGGASVRSVRGLAGQCHGAPFALCLIFCCWGHDLRRDR